MFTTHDKIEGPGICYVQAKIRSIRTNNPLERFNREINAALTAPHPSLPAFVSIIQVLSQRYVD
ncbi:hypothetical protein PHMEG_00032843 [Phytophthora megakarya]|uniref:Uncharacterized protein n=1 Tax=Phytophthora megakarya TaxID=4795 RepID=A0A225UX24_9STRA|nr:hypothetical protein PHMEG_00032843 [Phytophthora megakarya]